MPHPEADAARMRRRVEQEDRDRERLQSAEYRRELKRVRESTKPALLHNLKSIYMARGQTPRSLSLLTDISKQRISALANATAMEEPWFDEAVTLARSLNTGGIVPLITSGTLTDCSMGVAFDSDEIAFRSSTRIPLTLACRLARKYGMSDPIELVTQALPMQLWDVISTNERGAEPGCCPWCLSNIAAGETHRETCIPNNLWASRTSASRDTLMFPVRPSGKLHRRMASARGAGLAGLRRACHMTQAQFGSRCGVSPNTLARLERCEINLTQKTAEKIAAAFNVSVESLYILSEDDA